MSQSVEPVGKVEAAAANQMAKAFMGSMITFLATITYLGMAAASTTDVQLLIGRDIRLPLLGIDVSVQWFFPIACWMTLVLHGVFLLQVHFLFRKLRPIAQASEAHRTLVPAILVEAFFPVGKRKSTNWITRVVLILPLVPIPWLLFWVILRRFWPTRPSDVEQLLCVAAIVADVVVCWVLIPKILQPARSSLRGGSGSKRHRRKVLTMELGSLVFLLVPLLAAVALEPGDCRSQFRWLRGAAELFEPCIDAADAELVGVERGQQWLVADPDRRIATLRLTGRDLRFADLSRAQLVGADLRGSDLRGALLRQGRLTGADLSGADLSGADLSGADLRGARLYRAGLRRAELTGADLRGADLTGALLTGARAGGARLDAALLPFADLRGAVLDLANLSCADLGSVLAGGLRARGAVALGANLRSARLVGSHWADARLVGADFRGALLVASDFHGADLSRSLELPLRKLDLRQARLVGASPPLAVDETAAVLTDARSVVWERAAGERADSLEELLDEGLRRSLEPFPGAGDRLRACTSRLQELLVVAPTVPTAPTAAGRTPMERAFYTPPARSNLGVGAGALTEKPFHRSLLGRLVDPLSPNPELDPDACSSDDLARSLILRSQGCLQPRDPVFERRLTERILEVLAPGEPPDPAVVDDCPALRDAYQRLPSPLRLRLQGEGGDVAWPPASDFPRWSGGGASCGDLHRGLWD